MCFSMEEPVDSSAEETSNSGDSMEMGAESNPASSAIEVTALLKTLMASCAQYCSVPFVTID